MTEITITVDGSRLDHMGTARRLIFRHHGRLRLMGQMAAVVTCAVAGGVTIAWLIGQQSLADAGLISLYAVIGGVIGLFITSRWLSHRLSRTLAASPLRGASVKVVLSDAGITPAPRSLRWADIIDVQRHKAETLILLSPIEAIVLPDADLPQGVTAEQLRNQIALWRSA